MLTGNMQNYLFSASFQMEYETVKQYLSVTDKLRKENWTHSVVSVSISVSSAAGWFSTTFLDIFRHTSFSCLTHIYTGRRSRLADRNEKEKKEMAITKLPVSSCPSYLTVSDAPVEEVGSMNDALSR